MKYGELKVVDLNQELLHLYFMHHTLAGGVPPIAKGSKVTVACAFLRSYPGPMRIDVIGTGDRPFVNFANNWEFPTAMWVKEPSAEHAVSPGRDGRRPRAPSITVLSSVSAVC